MNKRKKHPADLIDEILCEDFEKAILPRFCMNRGKDGWWCNKQNHFMCEYYLWYKKQKKEQNGSGS